jgi:hypothetical protein
MAIHYLPLYENGKLTEKDFDLVKEGLLISECKVREINEFKDLDDVDVFVQALSLPKYFPILGFACSKHEVRITVDPDQPFYRDANNELLSQTYSHKLHHILRIRKPGYGKTLGEVLISEGLAQIFELETGHQKASNYSVHFGKNELLAISESAHRIVLSKEPYNKGHWFFGTEDVDLDNKEKTPRWLEYSLGFAIVSSWLKQNQTLRSSPYTTAAKAVNVDANSVLEPWLKEPKNFLIPWIEEDLPDIIKNQAREIQHVD